MRSSGEAMLELLFDGWRSVGRIIFLAGGIYLVVLAGLRARGETALAKMSAYDLIITIALGSVVASVPLSPQVTLADGAALILTFLVLQGILRFGLKHVPRMRHAAKGRPRLVCWDGELLPDRLHAFSITEAEVRAAIRRASLGSVSDVQAVVLENDGEWSVIPKTRGGSLSALEDVDRGKERG